jgi:excisionase family DNA binding protein
MNALARALLADLEDEDLRELAERLAPYLSPQRDDSGDAWLSTSEAARYLGVSVHALRKRTAERTVPFVEDEPGGKCYFRRSDLDAWRQS